MLHTPGKLHVTEDDFVVRFHLVSDGLLLVAALVADHHAARRKADGDRLALCWNMHDSLVAALRGLVDSLSFPMTNKETKAFHVAIDALPPASV